MGCGKGLTRLFSRQHAKVLKLRQIVDYCCVSMIFLTTTNARPLNKDFSSRANTKLLDGIS